MSDKEMYSQRGFASRVGFGARPALLIIDFIKGFTDTNCPLGSNLDAEVTATRILLELFRQKGLPVHLTTTAYDGEMVSAGVFVKKVPSLAHLKIGSKWIEIDDRLAPRAGEVVWTKQYASAFFGTSLNSALAAQRVDTLIVTGCTTSGCVRASAVDACQYGLRACVVRECVGDRSAEAHESNLNDLDAKYADVVSLESALEYVQKL